MINIYSMLATAFNVLSIITGVAVIVMCIKAGKFYGEHPVSNTTMQPQQSREELKIELMEFDCSKLKYYLRILIVFIIFLVLSSGCIISTLINPHVLEAHLCRV